MSYEVPKTTISSILMLRATQTHHAGRVIETPVQRGRVITTRFVTFIKLISDKLISIKLFSKQDAALILNLLEL